MLNRELLQLTIIVSLVAPALGAEANSSIKHVRIFLVAGQSNAAGRAGAKELSPQYQEPLDDVDFSPGGGGKIMALRPAGSQFGPEITLAYGLREAFKDEAGTRLAIVKTAAGGTSLIHNWKGNGTSEPEGDGNLYRGLQEQVKNSRTLFKEKYPQAEVTIEGMLWVQGEADTAGARPAYYEENLRTFIKDVRATFGPDVRFVISRFSNNQTGFGEKPRNIIRAAQERVAAEDPRNGIIDTDDFGVGGDQCHYNAAGQEAIGKAAAAEMVRLLKVVPKTTATKLESK